MKVISYRDPLFDKEKVSNLYLTAFPEEERPPLFYFYDSLKSHKDNELLSYYDGDAFIGFTYLVIYQDIVYLFFLAVDSKQRNKGYGTKIIQYLKDRYLNKTIILCYEEVDEKYSDYQLRKRRQDFYFRNSFIDNHMKTDEYGVIYQTAYIGNKPIDFTSYINMLIKGFSSRAKDYIKEVK